VALWLYNSQPIHSLSIMTFMQSGHNSQQLHTWSMFPSVITSRMLHFYQQERWECNLLIVASLLWLECPMNIFRRKCSVLDSLTGICLFTLKVCSLEFLFIYCRTYSGDYIYGYWIDNWIYWITHSYTQLQCIHSYNSLQFTITLAES
jgi:hypothetical protein